tara:strand:- start:2281 stop:2895 length:615 start_codon:yes stop_codon:yes gene_type:complete
MNKKLRPRTTVTFEELRQALEQCGHNISQDAFDQFCKRVHSSTQIFLEIDEPKLIAKELREINRIARKPKYTLLNVIGKASRGTITLLEDLKPLPPMPSANDEAGIKAYAKDIRERIIIKSRKLSDRVKNHLIGPSKNGRPLNARIDVLVSFVAAAYVSATDKGFRREWDADGDLPFHQVLETVFKTLSLDASVDEAIRRLLST